MKSDITQLNRLAWQRVLQYQHMNIAGRDVSCPYAINFFSRNITTLMNKAGLDEATIKTVTDLYKQRQIPYGWYRGKGTPEEIVEAVNALAKIHEYNLTNSSSEGVAEFMKLFGLGIDCSGLVYHVLDFAWSQVIGQQQFSAAFTWPSDTQYGVNYASAQLLADNSNLVIPDDVRPLDLVCIHEGAIYSHIGLVLENDQGLQIVQSNISQIPTGINVSELEIKSGQPYFGYIPAIGLPWNDYKDLIEFRRLNLD